jgi:hypothetical protein
MAAPGDDHDYAVLVVFEQLSPSHPSPSPEPGAPAFSSPPA